MTYLEVER